MSQKSHADQPVVRAVLEDVLNKVLDEKFARFPTRDELDEKLKNFATKDDLKMLEAEIDENARKYRDQIMDKYSPIVSDIATLREENEIGTYQVHEIRETTKDHEKRIAVLEQKPLVA